MYAKAIEKENKNKGRRISIVIHLLLLLIAFIYSFQVEVKDPDPEKPYRVMVDFDFKESSLSTYAHADVGESRPKNTEVQKVEVNDPKPPTEEITEEVTPPSVPIPATPTPPVVTKTTVEESTVKIDESPIEIDAPSREEVPVVKPKAEPSRPTTTNTTPGRSGAGTVGSPTGTSSRPQSTSNGSGQGKSNTGTGRGSDSGPDVTSGIGNSSDGTGEYDGSGNGIFKRKVIYRNVSALPMTTSGKVVIKTCINRMGTVTFTEIINAETTIKDRAILKKTLTAAKGYKYQPDPNAPKEQCGKLTVSLDIDALRRK